MNETMRISLHDYLTIFRWFGNCGIDGNYGFYWFKTTSEPKLELFMLDDYIELYECGSHKFINSCYCLDLLVRDL